MRYLILLLILFLFSVVAPAQITYPDTSRWIGQWADEGDLTYTLNAMLVEDEQGWVTGWFEWTMIYSPYWQHLNKVGHAGREYLEGKRHKLTGFYHLAHTRVEQEMDVISGDEYIIQVVNDGTKMLGRNFRPENYKGSLYALRVPKVSPVLAIRETSKNPESKEELVKEELPGPKVVVVPDPPPPPVEDDELPVEEEVVVEEVAAPDSVPPSDFGDRTILTKDEVAVGENQVRIEIWDKSMVDGDIVSLDLNGEVILARYRVTGKRKALVLDLQEGANLLVMHAENLGRIPPNTAAIAVYREKQSEVYILNSDMGKSEAIRIIRK